MTFLIWNVRGPNDPLKQKSIVARIKKLNAHLVYLIETRVKENKSQPIIARHFERWNWTNNYSSAYNGRIWIIWGDHIKVDVVASTAQCVTCKILIDAKQFYFSVVYGFNEGVLRKNLWKHLDSLHGSLCQSPWMLAKDFNIIANTNESSNPDRTQGLRSDIKDFQESIQKLVIFDHAYTGPTFTWSNHQGNGFLARKLDRAMINDKWSLSFYHSTVEFLAPGDSDHCPILVRLEQPTDSKPKPFKFFNFWTNHPEFLTTVAKSWKEPMMGSPMEMLRRK